MKKLRFTLLSFAAVAVFAVSGAIVSSQQAQLPAAPKFESRTAVQTKESQAAMTPARALEVLKEGNFRFSNGMLLSRDIRAQVLATSTGQFPYATIVSCQDSRTSNELLFDMNNGDAFSLRIAGNIVNDDILGGLEFGSKAAGAKLIAVIGHTKCGAINGACDDVKLGNLTGLLAKIKPAVDMVPASIQPRNSKNPEFVKAVTEANVRYQMKQIREKSPIIKEMIDKGEVALVGGIYDLSTGKVQFLD